MLFKGSFSTDKVNFCYIKCNPSSLNELIKSENAAEVKDFFLHVTMIVQMKLYLILRCFGVKSTCF